MHFQKSAISLTVVFGEATDLSKHNLLAKKTTAFFRYVKIIYIYIYN